MRIGPPPKTPPRPPVGGTIVEFCPPREPSDEDGPVEARLTALRDRIRRGEYEVDPLRIATSLYEAIRSGGI